MYLKNFDDCAGRQGLSIGTPLDPPHLWLDNTLNGEFFNNKWILSVIIKIRNSEGQSESGFKSYFLVLSVTVHITYGLLVVDIILLFSAEILSSLIRMQLLYDNLCLYCMSFHRPGSCI